LDLSRFDTRERAHEGVDVPLVVDGETVMGDDDQPVTFRLKGLADPDVMKALMASARGGVARTPEELLAGEMKLVRVAVVGWSSNFSVGNDEKGNPVKVAFSRENVEKVFGIPAIRRAVIGEVATEAHFMKRG
jgi:hypothetical protein